MHRLAKQLILVITVPPDRIGPPDGTPLVTGISSWLLVDPAAHRIIPTKQFDLRKPVETQKTHDCLKYGKIAVPEQLDACYERTILYSDIDGNGHVNNARYGAFMADAIPESLRGAAFTDFRLNYAKEAKLGETLRVFRHIDEGAKKMTVVGRTDGGTSFESELFWN